MFRFNENWTQKISLQRKNARRRRRQQNVTQISARLENVTRRRSRRFERRNDTEKVVGRNKDRKGGSKKTEIRAK